MTRRRRTPRLSTRREQSYLSSCLKRSTCWGMTENDLPFILILALVDVEMASASIFFRPPTASDFAGIQAHAPKGIVQIERRRMKNLNRSIGICESKVIFSFLSSSKKWTPTNSIWSEAPSGCAQTTRRIDSTWHMYPPSADTLVLLYGPKWETYRPPGD